MAGTQPTKSLISEVETVEFGGLNRKVTVEYDHLTNEETTTNWVDDGLNGWVTESVSMAQSTNWNSNHTYRTLDPNYYQQSGNITITNPTTGGIVTGAGSLQINPPSADAFDVEDLIPLLELVGHCVACGDDAELLLCPPCGLAVRELGRMRLQEYMKEIQEELS